MLSSEDLAEQALIVLREALSNMARHAGASRADVTVDVDQDGFLSVIVTDDGTGIPAGGRRSGLFRGQGPAWNGESRPGPSRRLGRTGSGP